MLNYQYQPVASWNDFESLCRDLYASNLNSRMMNFHGRNDSPQNGIDLYGYYNNDNKTVYGVQCKGKEIYPEKELKITEIENEIIKARVFEPKLTHYIIATTARRNIKIQEKLRKLVDTMNLDFTVEISFWDDIEKMLNHAPEVASKYYPPYLPIANTLYERDMLDDKANLITVYKEQEDNIKLVFICPYFPIKGYISERGITLDYGHHFRYLPHYNNQVKHISINFKQIVEEIENFFYGEEIRSFNLFFNTQMQNAELSITAVNNENSLGFYNNIYKQISGYYYVKDHNVYDDNDNLKDSHINKIYFELYNLMASLEAKITDNM